MKIGSLQFSNPLVLAPLAGISDYPFRQMARRMGCDLAFTGLISAEGLLRRKRTYLRIERDDHPLSVQLFGSDPKALAEAAGWAEEEGADAIDINMGCPAPQVTGVGAGVDLMRSPERVKQILLEVRRRVKGPLTIKIRSGWDRNRVNAVEVSRIAQDLGVDAIILHPRTGTQGFRGKADWGLIGEVKRSVDIPVIGNGNVTTPSLARKMMEETGCDGVMIGRGSLGNPWIFSPTSLAVAPPLEERRRGMMFHLTMIEEHYGQQESVEKIKTQIFWYTKGLPGSSSLRDRLRGIEERTILFETVANYFDSMQRRNLCLSFP